MTALQLAALGGALAGLGLTLILARLLPARVDPRWALDRLNPTETIRPRPSVGPDISTGGQELDLETRLGLLVLRRGPTTLLDRTPRHDLAVVRRSPAQFYGQKAVLGGLGLVGPALFASVFVIAGDPLPFVIPTVVGIALAIVLWFAPDGDLRQKAAQARRQFVHAVSVYLDLVALQRLAGDGPTQALRSAAAAVDAWEFSRIHEALAQAELAGVPPWEALKALGDELAVHELADVAEIMRLSSAEGSSVYEQLRARAASIRGALLSDAQSAANAAVERLTLPVTCLFLIFGAFLGTPAFARILGG